MRHDVSPDRFQRYYVPKNKVPVAVFSAWRIDISKSQNSAIGHGSAKAHLPACGSVTSVFNTEQRRPTALLTVPRLRKVCVESHFTHHALTLPIHSFVFKVDILNATVIAAGSRELAKLSDTFRQTTLASRLADQD